MSSFILPTRTLHLILLCCCIVGLSQAFKVQAACTANGKRCQSDQECCSNWCPMVYPDIFMKCQATSNCNGNCPSGACRGCKCPTTKAIVDLNAYCTPNQSGWAVNCCKCIVGLTSGGNAHFQRYSTDNQIGVLPIPFLKYVRDPCRAAQVNICDWQSNKRCAETIYGINKNWSQWADAAARCGC